MRGFPTSPSVRRPRSSPRLEPLEDRCVPAFGTNGIVLTDVAATSGEWIQSTALQADGKTGGPHPVWNPVPFGFFAPLPGGRIPCPTSHNRRSSMRRHPFMALLLAAAIALMLASPAEAGVLANHAAVFASAMDGVSSSGYYVSAVGDGALTTGVVYADAVTHDTRQFLWGQSQASTSPTGSGLLKTFATAYGQPGPIPGINYGGVADAAAIWTDIAFVDGPTPPDRIYAHVSVDGRLSVRAEAGVHSELLSRVGVYYATYELTLTPPFLPINGGVPAQLTRDSFFVGDWESYTFSGGDFHGTLSFPLFYDTTLGGYRFAVQLRTEAGAQRGFADANFFNSLDLTGFTLADGTPVQVRFDSGLSLSAAVPEPGSALLAGLGVLCILFRKRAKLGALR